ncbi:translesion error-prone DNA polymerase V autoproteolytic subunit [Neochlamydia sp. AcF84]|uniref:LexA family protein n=1 Tax=Neochlamydia sp. AcF84 TaxID=2315858 RepID=UPI001F60AFB0|nr:translesion error-prone DNA polymerase V autoproteolytic subunit [Neochlamydia sp. AcF84]
MKTQTMDEIFYSSSSAAKKLLIPLFQDSVSAGFPSPAENYIEKRLDLNELMVKHPASTFFVRVQGDSMREAGVCSGDILVVDRSLAPLSGKIIVAIVNGEFMVRRYVLGSQGIQLVSAHPSSSILYVNATLDFQVWGVVTYVIHRPQ